jgi:HAD superfamily hydrolase (TIGR01459 family)
MSAVVHDYDGFIIDQWGVLHDGTHPYAGAAECLAQLHSAGKRVVVLSNSGKRESENLRLMARLGFPAASFERFVSAGEDARQAIAARIEPFHRALGTRCYAFTRDGDRSLLEGIGLEWARRVEDADFLVVLGSDSPRRKLADYDADLKAGIARKLPMICANPDLLRLSPEGTIEAPGVLAQRYAALGGNVFYHGKPYPAIYRSCLAALGCAPERILAVGDSIDHDILGAARIGLRSALVASGVHAAALHVRFGQMPTPAVWRRFAAGTVAVPDYLLPAFVW